MLAQIRDAASRVDGSLARCYLDHWVACAAADATALDDVSRRFEGCRALLYAPEAAETAARAHAPAGPRPAPPGRG